MPGRGGSGVLVDHEGVPGGQQRPGQGGDHHRVVDVGDHAEPGLRDRPRRRSDSAVSEPSELRPIRCQPGDRSTSTADVDDAARCRR